jgi:predicted amidophosphoribosyltransferase
MVRRRGIKAFLRSIEETWLGLEAPAAAERIVEDGWTPDGPDAYCGRCGGSVGPFEQRPTHADGTPGGCPRCVRRRLAWQRAIRLGSYEGLLRELVLDVKFRRDRRAGGELGGLLGEAVRVAVEDAGLAGMPLVIVPVPTTHRRRLGRGIDHTLVLSRAVAGVTGGRVVRALDRAHRPPQHELPTSSRRSNVAGTFHRRPGFDLSGRLVVVVDDVRTTGATMTAACRALRNGSEKEIARPPVVWVAFAAVAGKADPRQK